jgi:hypothetical protein
MELAEATLTAKPPGYATVLELDRRVRELSVPESYKPCVSASVLPFLSHYLKSSSLIAMSQTDTPHARTGRRRITLAPRAFVAPMPAHTVPSVRRHSCRNETAQIR